MSGSEESCTELTPLQLLRDEIFIFIVFIKLAQIYQNILKFVASPHVAPTNAKFECDS